MAMQPDDERLAGLLEYSRAAERICPQPTKWHEFWKLMGSPRDLTGPPLILAGWAFSTDRDKRERFNDHLRYAAGAGLLDEAEKFVQALAASDWHTAPDDHLDWSYGDALIEDEERRKAAIRSASEHYATLREVVRDDEAFNKEHLSETLFLFHLLFGSEHTQSLVQVLRHATQQFSSLAGGDEFSLLDNTPSSVSETLNEVNRAKRIELLLLEILNCITDAGIPLDRDAVDEFVDAIFNHA